MDIQLSLIDGYIPDKYSKHAEKENIYKGNPCTSFPINLPAIPEGTKSLAFTLIDYDAIPGCGFAWIHWIAANVVPEEKIAENISRKDSSLVQGQNSFSSQLAQHTDKEITCRYIGPQPPDEDHVYTFTVYALDSKLDLKEGYYLNELFKAMKDHVLEKEQVNFLARP